MHVLKKTIIVLLFIASGINTMEQQARLSANDRKTLVTALNSYKVPNYFPARSAQELEIIITFAQLALHDQKTLQIIKNEVKNISPDVKKNKEWIIQLLNDLIQKADKKLKSNQPKKNKPIVKLSFLEPEVKATPQKIVLYKFIEAYLDNDNNYMNTRANPTYQTVLDAIASLLNNPAETAHLKNYFSLDQQQVKKLLEGIILKIRDRLDGRENTENVIAKELIASTSEQKQSQSFPSQVISREQAEKDEKLANRLYIGLDIKEHNAKGDSIRWKEAITAISSKITDGEFIPNDYFHITIAWYESDKPIAPEIISKVEHALANASQILKIVFPLGVTGIMLLDGAVLLGARKDSVAFRVAESNDLKKLQEILLKFLSFEKIEGFKFSTFQKETPIHVTLGKIRPSKNAYQYQNAAEVLNAPSGARAANNEGFTINTFRLTYSSAGHAWQEKMSYKF